MSICQHTPERIETDLGTIYRCQTCGQNITHWQRKLQNLYIKQRFYQGQGVSYTSWVMGIYNTIQTGGILYLVLGGQKLGGWAMPIFLLAWLLQTIVETWIGRQDYKKWKMAQRQQTLSASFAPPVAETLRILNELRDKISPETKRPSILDNQLK